MNIFSGTLISGEEVETKFNGSKSYMYKNFKDFIINKGGSNP